MFLRNVKRLSTRRGVFPPISQGISDQILMHVSHDWTPISDVAKRVMADSADNDGTAATVRDVTLTIEKELVNVVQFDSQKNSIRLCPTLSEMNSRSIIMVDHNA
eukprot:PhF_6_TR42188/c0_g1_i3/m.63820